MVFAIAERAGQPSFLPNSRMFSCSQKNVCLFSFYLRPLAPGPRGTTRLFSVSMDLPILDTSHKWSYTTLSPLYLLHIPSIVFLRLIHVVTWIGTSFLFMVEYYSVVQDSTFCLPSQQLMDIWVASISGRAWIMLLWTFMYEVLCGHMFSILSCIYLRVEMQGYG